MLRFSDWNHAVPFAILLRPDTKTGFQKLQVSEPTCTNPTCQLQCNTWKMLCCCFTNQHQYNVTVFRWTCLIENIKLAIETLYIFIDQGFFIIQIWKSKTTKEIKYRGRCTAGWQQIQSGEYHWCRLIRLRWICRRVWRKADLGR